MLKSEFDAELSKRARQWGRKGGLLSVKKLRTGKTQEQLSEIMRARANVRWEAVKLREAAK